MTKNKTIKHLFFMMCFIFVLSGVVAKAEAVLKVNDAIYLAFGRGAINSNTFMVITGAGNVIIDTSGHKFAPKHKMQLKNIDSSPIKYIILTHGHGDHRGGVPVWKEEGVKVIAQRDYVEFLHYQKRLRSHFRRMGAAQFYGRRIAKIRLPEGNYPAKIDADILYSDTYEFKLGDIEFQLFHTPGETYDHTTVWIPKYKAAFVGDNYYRSFPNLYTLRGTKPRWALDYVESINKIMKLGPEILLPSHGVPIRGREEIIKTLTRYRDAILYVHDQTVLGLNQGKDKFTLMKEIKLPPELDVGEGYGKVSWSVRGIYEGYVGWFDGNPVSMYTVPQSSVFPELAEMAGGADRIAEKANQLLEKGETIRSLHLADIALEADPDNREALKVRLSAYEKLLSNTANIIEKGWLKYGLNLAREKLEILEAGE